MIIVAKKKNDVEILSAIPLSDVQDYPMIVHFVHDGRRYATITDDANHAAAARKSLSEQRIPLENLCDVLQCVLIIIANQNRDFYGQEPYREVFEEETDILWPVAVYNILHDIVKFRLHKFFYYGDGLDDLCVYQDILTKISLPYKNHSLPF